MKSSERERGEKGKIKVDWRWFTQLHIKLFKVKKKKKIFLSSILKRREFCLWIASEQTHTVIHTYIQTTMAVLLYNLVCWKIKLLGESGRGEGVKRGSIKGERSGVLGLSRWWGGVYLRCSLRTGLDWPKIRQSTLQCQYCWTVCWVHTPSATWRRRV